MSRHESTPAPMTPIDKIQRARALLCIQLPYDISDILFGMRFVADPSATTMATNARWEVSYNPEFVSRLDQKQLAFVLAHEAHHVLRDAWGRAALIGAEWPLWGIAHDLEINDDLVSLDGIVAPEGEDRGVYPHDFSLPVGRTAEEYYKALREQRLNNSQRPCGCESMKRTAANPQQCDGSGRSRDGEDGMGGLSEIERALARESAARKILEAARQRGNMPGDLVRIAEAILGRKVPWRRLLRAKLQYELTARRGNIDYSYERVSPPRFPGDRVIRPSLVAPEVKLAMVIDTSGSMDRRDLGLAAQQVYELTRSFGCPVTVLSCDAEVHKTFRVTRRQDRLELVGGGGTSMAAGIEAAEKIRQLTAIVVVTDGYTDWPDRAPRVSTYVALTRPEKQEAVPAWAKTVLL